MGSGLSVQSGGSDGAVELAGKEGGLVYFSFTSSEHQMSQSSSVLILIRLRYVLSSQPLGITGLDAVGQICAMSFV